MEVKDLKSMKIKAKTNKKDIKIEDTNIDTLKSTSIKVDKKTWEDYKTRDNYPSFKRLYERV